MPYCPRCHAEYRRSVTRCPDCRVDLLPGSSPASPRPAPDTRPVRLCTVPDASAGDILRAALAEHGIPALVQRHGPITGELARITNGLTEDYAIVLVPANRLAQAREVLAVIESAPTVWPEGMEPED